MYYRGLIPCKISCPKCKAKYNQDDIYVFPEDICNRFRTRFECTKCHTTFIINPRVDYATLIDDEYEMHEHVVTKKEGLFVDTEQAACNSLDKMDDDQKARYFLRVARDKLDPNPAVRYQHTKIEVDQHRY